MIYWYPCRPYLIEPTNPKVAEFSADPNWTAEKKFNGDRLVLQKHNDPTPWKQFDNFTFASRHKDYLKRYVPLPSVMDELKSLNLPNNTQLDGELMHFKTKHIKHRIILYDIYVLDGQQMTGVLDERRDILAGLLKGKSLQHIEQAQVYPDNFTKLYTEVIQSPEIEGLVMKDRRGKIMWNTVASNDVGWSFKIRKPNPNYKF
jgi:ATP-dependent DNA ligase